MRTLVFLDYWSLHEPLTQATVLPTLRMLHEEALVDRVVLVTVERGPKSTDRASTLWPGVDHVPLVAHKGTFRPVDRARDLLSVVPRVTSIIRQEGADHLMARGVVAGGFSHFISARAGVPYAVDYFEPHNRYMTDVGEWSKGGVLDRSLDWSIRRQTATASYCVTVAENYRRMLLQQGVQPAKLLVAPCPVDEERMRFSPGDRQRVREELAAHDAVIGVYAGKFGGLYHRQEAFRAFAEAQRIVGDRFVLIVLTPEEKEAVVQGIRSAGFVGDRLMVRYAQHHEVPAYLSAADLAFAPYRGTPSSACISPMKIGEYWANGLPVLLTRGVGDDSAIIEADAAGGALFDPTGNDITPALARILDSIAQPGQRERTASLARAHRGMDRTIAAYRTILGSGFNR